MQHRRSGLLRRVLLSALAWTVSPLAGQELPLQREYPGSRPYECPAPIGPVEPGPDARAQAGQLASEANQAMILGDLERVQVLLGRAVESDPTSADLAYRSARVLEDLGEVEPAMDEFCRALDLEVESIGIFDVQSRLDALFELVRTRIPTEARDAFVSGLTLADSSAFEEAAAAFTIAIETAPDWGAPLYNRALVYEYLGRIRASLDDYRAYLTLAPSSIDPIVAMVSERIGLLEGAASVATPSPSGAAVLGIVPGMGHFYIGRPARGTLTLAAASGALAAGLFFKKITTLCLQDVAIGASCPSDLIVAELTERPYFWQGVAVGAAVTVVGAIDALLSARRRRAETATISDQEGNAGPRIGGPTMSARGGQVDVNLIRLMFR
ncbi:MAG: hypothetical protein O2958_12825 [Gemmatimonadetes bacterium]|nr:hypothetical protein [Gemmatimonadota bacterium]MDA1103205.1 hypothetical protein [Gemmatimonadota bacterium]